ncbi:hypothetical protein EZJ43_01570 [Pedobacter changchengzhani]|uniref:Lipoprotein n=1 Tax=Pedobacter changchengzhani TaxID=2529274 RepID=A0A4R5MPM2_9SPHI|nr:hypothetical protein [Pedobacter changchengzhani]TDG37807.1 hypothetical protein EZJ43_01570 [Pedobacter changchengzhani]
MKFKLLVLFIFLITACKQKREVNTSFYFWKTVYKQQKVENNILNTLNSKKLYIRIMDVDLNLDQKLIPIAPIKFVDSVPKNLEIVPVVFIVNNALKNQDERQLAQLAINILAFVQAKVLQAGAKSYKELQIDCDWTATTKTEYFTLLKLLKQHDKSKILSSTLRLHQLKNQEKSGIPPCDKVLLMCYNMGNLRKYGTQNSILDVEELKKYAGENLAFYPMNIDIALPLFSWCVVFRNQQYAGISKRLNLADLKNPELFTRKTDGLYTANTNLPAYGLIKNDEVRYEESKINALRETATYLTTFLSQKPISLIYYHLDYNLLKNYETHQLKEIANIFR